MRLRAYALSTLAAMAMAAPAAAAVVIGFEASETSNNGGGYTPGVLTTATSGTARWVRDGATGWNVVAGVGNGGQAIQPNATDTTNRAARYFPTASQLSIGALSGFSGKLTFSFDARLDSFLASNSTGAMGFELSDRNGTNQGYPVSVLVQRGGGISITYHNGTTNVSALVAGVFPDATSWVTITAEADYAARTTTFKKTVGGTTSTLGTYAFRLNSGTGVDEVHYAAFSMQGASASTSPYVVSVDNVSLVVPEPASLGFLAAGALMLRRRRRA